MLLQTIKYTMI